MIPRVGPFVIIIALGFVILIFSAIPSAESNVGDAASEMRARYDTVAGQLTGNHFDQPIRMSSSIEDERISGELIGVIEHSFETATAAFKLADAWCDIMMLHLNVKHCRASLNGPELLLKVFVGRKHHQSLESAYCGEYRYRVMDEMPDYFRVVLTADSGPLQTKNYQIQLEAVPTDHGQTFVRFVYSYDFGVLARIAKSVYFNTKAREKVGFTVVENGPDGHPVYVGGVRGALERNLMRYYLAMKAYLGALPVPPQERLEKRLQDWFALTELYPLQLHELDKNEYLRMKRQEHERWETR